MTKQNPISNLINNSVKGLLTTTAITAVGIASMSGVAKAENNLSGLEYVGGSEGSSISTTVTGTVTDITAVGAIVKTSGDADLDEGLTANILQDDSSSKFIIFDTEADPTFIRGNLNANGEVLIFDRDGVIFTDTAQVNVGAIVASSGRLTSTDKDLNNGKVKIQSSSKDGAVENRGSITCLLYTSPSPRDRG